jgi:asparagine synthase (glutamine-hydrolysing)
METLPLLVERYGEPYADSSCLPTYYVSKETRGFVTVALNGDGGDESFAGYDRYQAMLIASRLENMPLTMKNLVRRFALLLPDSIDSKNRFRRIRRFFEAAFLPAHVRYAKWVSIFDESLKKEIYSDDLLNSVSLANSEDMIKDFITDKNKEDIVDALLNTDMHTYLPDDLLIKVDIASMANSLEARSPFLDHKVMEFAARLPSEYKLKSGVKKYILKRAIKGLVPPENIYRPKMGFGLPIGKWFRQDLKNYTKETLLSRQSLGRGYFRPEIVKNMVNEHTECRKDYSFQLWALLMLELWHKRFIDNG